MYTDKNTAPNLHVNQFHCSKMISNQMSSLNNVAPCKIYPEKIGTNSFLVTLYKRSSKIKLEATMCNATEK